MDTYQAISLVRIRYDEVSFQAWSTSFRVKTDTMIDEQVLYNKFMFCVKRFLQTDKGRDDRRLADNNISWLEIVDAIPSDFWEQFGIHLVTKEDSPFQCCGSTALVVYLDEVLCAALPDLKDERCLCNTCTHRITERNGEPVMDCSEGFIGVSEIEDDGEIILSCDDYLKQTDSIL